MTVSVPLEDNYEATLTQALSGDGAALTIYVSKTPVATIPAGTEMVMTINPGKGFTAQENVLVESYDASAKTLTVKTSGRAQNRYNGDSPTALTHAVGSKIILSDPYPVWNALDDFMPKTGGTFTGPVDFSGASTTFKLPNLTETERDALTAANGMKIYNTTAGEEQVYNGGSWFTVAAGSTQPNASETVAGKVEFATLAEITAGTQTGATGADLVMNPQYTATDSGDAAEGKVVKCNSDSQVDASLIPSEIKEGISTTGTAGETIADQEGLSYDGIGQLLVANSDESDRTGLWAGVSTSAGAAAATINYVPHGPLVDVPTFSMASRGSCRLYDDQTQNTSDTTTDKVYGTVWRSQTFTVGTGVDNIGAVRLSLTANGTPANTYTCAIRATSAGEPTGGNLVSANLTAANMATGINDFVFSTPLSVTAGTQYAIVLYSSSSTVTNCYSWNYKTSTSPYADGTRVTSADGGSTWAIQTNDDCYFITQYRGISGEPVFLDDVDGDFVLDPQGDYPMRVGSAVSASKIALSTPLRTVYGTLTGSMPDQTNAGTTSIDSEITIGGRAAFVWYSAYATSTWSSHTAYNPEFRFVGFDSPAGGNYGLAICGEDDDRAAGSPSFADMVPYASEQDGRSYRRNNFSDYARIQIYVQSYGADTITFRRSSYLSDTGVLTGGTFNIYYVAFLY